MASFIDSLAVMLIALAMSTFLGSFYFYFRARGNIEQIKNMIYPALGIGFFDFISGFYMSFAWPLPGGYNMLFGDPLLLTGLLMIITALTTYKNVKAGTFTTESSGLGLIPIFFVLLGIYVMVGAYSIVEYKLESGQNLITALGLYIFDGLGAILSPIAYLKPEGGKKYLYYLEWVILGIGTIFALVIGYMALNGHLLDFMHYFP